MQSKLVIQGTQSSRTPHWLQMAKHSLAFEQSIDLHVSEELKRYYHYGS